MANQDDSGKIIKSISPSKIFLPILIGVGVAGYMLFKEYKPGSFDIIQLSMQTVFWLLLSLMLMAFRDIGYMYRIRLLSGNILSWKKSFSIIMLWEFSSAITPSAIGGTGVAVFFLNKEGITIGRSSAIVMVTSFLDELFFIIMFPIIILLVANANVFSFGDFTKNVIWYKNQFFIFAIIGYSLKFIYIIILLYGLFINPRGLKFLLLWIFKLPIIRKWRPNANESGTDLINASKEFKNWSAKNWVKAIVATFISWISRYWVANTIILSLFGFHYLNWDKNIIIFAKQLIMWIMMLVSPTPGGSGFAEYVFKEFMAGLIPIGTGIAIAFLWRLISYYPYLLIGSVIVPRWISKHFIKG